MKFIAPLFLSSCALAAHLSELLLDPRDLDWYLCPMAYPESCGSVTLDNSCCFEYPRGLIVLAQSWNYKTGTGPDDAFTLHGLWPEDCNGTFTGYCDNDIEVPADNITNILRNQYGDSGLVNDMDVFWKNPDGADEDFWAAQFNKHGSCITTLHQDCYGPALKPNENIYDYFKIAYNLYNSLPTFSYLNASGIVPSETATYTSEQISRVLTAYNRGKTVYFGCDEDNVLTDVHYHHHVNGPLIYESLVKVNATATPNCPATGIKFLPKS